MKRPSNSLYDPSGFVYQNQGRVFRVILRQAEKDWQHFVKSGLFLKLQEKKYLQPSEILPLQNCDYKEAVAFIEHKKIPCISYPYEWSFSMLRDAALFHLDVLYQCIQEGFITKDGSSYNIQFLGVNPIFIDLLSFIPYKGSSPWLGFTQFCQLFLFPLFISSYKRIPFQPWLKNELEGIDVFTTRRFFSLADILKPGLFSNVFLGAQFQKRFSQQKESLFDQISSARVINERTIGSLILRLQKTIKSLPLPKLPSLWEKYEEDNIYNIKDRKAKHQFVSEVVGIVRPTLILDLGTNRGEYVIPQSSRSNYIVAVDNDYQAIDSLYQRLKNKGIKNILPLVEDIVNPSPPGGWNLRQHQSFFSRLKPDIVLALALIHHIVVRNNIPLKNFVEWIVKLSPNLVIEFITKKDPMLRVLLKEKEDVYFDYNVEAFEKYLSQRGKIIKKHKLSSNSRILYFFRRQ